MKIITKVYIIVVILIAVALVNLWLFYSAQGTITSESHSILRAGDLKPKVEIISGLVLALARGDENSKVALEKEVADFDQTLDTLKKGGTIRGLPVTAVPSEVAQDYILVKNNWENYKKTALQFEVSSIYNKEVRDALDYILQKNTEMILTTDSLVRDLKELGRDYNRHKEISEQIKEDAKIIGQSVLLISQGEDSEEIRNNIKKARLDFNAGMKKLVGEPLNDEELNFGIKPESLLRVPRENSHSVDQLDLLWESVELRVRILESKSLYSEQYVSSINEFNSQKQSLIQSINSFLDMWNQDRIERRNQSQNITLAVIGVDIASFIIVIFVIKESLSPLGIIVKALSHVKEGIYGEQIKYSAKNEVGELASAFNAMSQTILLKDEEAKKTDIAKDEFLAMITHELKTPLVPIQGYADILLSGHLGNLTEKQKERIAIIKSSAMSLLQLISDLLDVQKLELGQLKMNKIAASIYSTVTKSMQTLKPEIDELEIKVENVVDPNIIVAHDPDRISQVVTNLIKNSLKALKPQTGVIKISSEQDENEVRISVSDNGQGIPYEKQAKLFTKFYQVDASLTREKGGSGLGLAICKGIVESHGGKISLKSTPNEGTTITFSLPKKR